MRTEYPKYFARFYDIIYHQIRDGIDNKFFLDEIKQTKGPVLEIGVGTGRFFIDALNQGADIYGIDISPSMVNVLKGKLNRKDHYRVSVIGSSDFKFDKKFSLIVAPFRMFSHLLTTNEQLKTLNNVYDHLNDDGEFIFDLFVPDLKMLSEGMDNVTDFEGEYKPGKKFKRIVSFTTDVIQQISDITMKFIWDEKDKEIEKEWKLKFRYFFRYELEYLISQSKLTLKDFYGDYHYNKIATGAKDFIIVCKKK